MKNQIPLGPPSDLVLILIYALVIALLMVIYTRGGFIAKLFSGFFAIGFLGLLLEELGLISGVMTGLLLSIVFISLAVGMIDRHSEKRLSVQNILAVFLVVVGIFSTIYWFNMATNIGFDGTLGEAFNHGWSAIRQIFNSGEVIYDQVNP